MSISVDPAKEDVKDRFKDAGEQMIELLVDSAIKKLEDADGQLSRDELRDSLFDVLGAVVDGLTYTGKFEEVDDQLIGAALAGIYSAGHAAFARSPFRMRARASRARARGRVERALALETAAQELEARRAKQ